MLSFGIELSRAFWTAFASARFASGSAPPSRAATMIARASFEKSCPRLASAAPFLCLMLDHLLCPDTRLLSHEVEEALVDAQVGRQLRMECSDEDAALAKEDGLAVELGEDLDVRAHRLDARCPDEDAAERVIVAGKLDVRLEAVHLPSVPVSSNDHVEAPEVRLTGHAVDGVARKEDHPGAGSE